MRFHLNGLNHWWRTNGTHALCLPGAQHLPVVVMLICFCEIPPLWVPHPSEYAEECLPLTVHGAPEEVGMVVALETSETEAGAWRSMS